MSIRRRPPTRAGSPRQDRLHQRARLRGLDAAARQGLRHQSRDRRGGEGMKTLQGRRARHDHGHGGSDPHAWQSVANAKIYVGQHPRRPDRGGSGRQADLRGECRGLPRRSSTRSRRGQGGHRRAFRRSAAGSSPPTTPSAISATPTASTSSRRRASRPRPRPRPRTWRASSGRSGAKRSRRCSWKTSPTRGSCERIAEETGARIGGTLYSDALSAPERAGAATYIDMMRHNIRDFSAALSS